MCSGISTEKQTSSGLSLEQIGPLLLLINTDFDDLTHSLTAQARHLIKHTIVLYCNKLRSQIKWMTVWLP